MEINVNKNDMLIELALTGNLDTQGSTDLQNTMNGIFEQGSGLKILMDFSSVPFMSSSGLRVLLLVTKKLNATGGSLELKNVSESVKEVFNMTGFSSILTIK